MKIFLLLFLAGFVCALPARQAASQRFSNVPIYQIDDYDDNDSDEQLYEIEERTIGNQYQKSSNVDRFKGIPLLFEDSDDEDSPTSRNNDRFFSEDEDEASAFRSIHRPRKNKRPFFYYERKNAPISKKTNNRFKNIPLIILNEDHPAYDDHDFIEVRVDYDDAGASEVYRKPIQLAKPTRRPQKRPAKRPQNRPKPIQKPLQKPRPKPTTQKPVIKEEQKVSSEALQVTTPILTTVSSIIEFSTEEAKKPIGTPTEEANKIEIPLPRNLDIIAFITKDGSIYEIDTDNENMLRSKNKPETKSELKNILEKSIKFTTDLSVEKDKMNKPEEKIQEVLKVTEPLNEEKATLLAFPEEKKDDEDLLSTSTSIIKSELS